MLNSKEDFRKCLLDMTEPLVEHFSKGRARLDLGCTAVYYDKRAISMEGISRLFWGFVPFFAGGGAGKKWEDILRSSLSSGTNPTNPEYWGGFTDKDQKFVEMAAIAYGILFAREVLWDKLTEEEQKNLAEYLYAINEYKLPECNWILFAVLVNLALKSVGKKYSKEKLETYLDMTESFYNGDGWYQDGDSNQKDYYISFAIHFYCLIYSKVMEKEDERRSKLFKERAMIFAKQFIYWFDDSGEALPFGRSLTYRFAQVSFFSGCLIAGIEPFSIGQMKGLIVRHMENWLKKEIFDREGILTIGYAYPNLIMAEAYNAPGSPYWAFKTFGILMLPDEHPFWNAKCEEFPKLEPLSPQPYSDKLMYHYGNHAAACPVGIFSPAGHGQSVPKYGKFVYDTCFGFCVSKSEYEFFENGPDSMLAFEIDGYIYVRRISIEGKINSDSTYSRWSPYRGIEVETVITPNATGHVRHHIIHSDIECQAYECGFSVASRDDDEILIETIDNKAIASNVFSSCSIEGQGVAKVLGVSPNMNVLYEKCVIPALIYDIKKGDNVFDSTIIAKKY